MLPRGHEEEDELLGVPHDARLSVARIAATVRKMPFIGVGLQVVR
jgi:hypothetical protein